MNDRDKRIYSDLKEKLDKYIIDNINEQDNEFIEGYSVALTDFQKACENHILLTTYMINKIKNFFKKLFKKGKQS